jgi:hypothetical protein
MKRIILEIAGIPLEIDYPAQGQLPHLNKFSSSCYYPATSLWRLQPIKATRLSHKRNHPRLSGKILAVSKRLERYPLLSRAFQEKKQAFPHLGFPSGVSVRQISFFQHGPVFIETGKRRISHFSFSAPNKNREFCNEQLVVYAYAQLLALYKGLLLHACGVIQKKKAYLFFGLSDAGKSTVAGLSKRYHVLSDDIIALRKVSSCYRAFTTPWKQGSFIQPQPHFSAPVAALFFLKKAKRISFHPLTPPEAMVRILSCHTHFFLYTERPLVDELFFTCAEFVKSAPAYLMEFQKDADFWPKLEEAVA